MNAVTEAKEQIVHASNAGSLLLAITQAASNEAMDIEKMERLFAMHQKMVAQEAEAAFNAALSRTQGKIGPVAAKAYNTHTQSRYAKLAAINDEIVPIYSGEGLSVSFDTQAHPDKGWIRTIALLSHERGHSRQYTLDLPLDDVGAKGTTNKTGVQATGSTSSYARRYLVCMIFNVSTFDDNDGNRDKKKDVEPDEAGKKILEACGSIGALQTAWKGLTAQQRSTLSAIKDDCKARIEAADKGAA